MTPKIINYLISITIMSFGLFILLKKKKEQPLLKLYGLPITTFIIISLSGIFLFAVLLVLTATGITR
jgi:hypothetical protein